MYKISIICRVPLDPCFAQGNTPMKTYNVVKGDKFKGEVRVGLVFTPEVSKLDHMFLGFLTKF